MTFLGLSLTWCEQWRKFVNFVANCLETVPRPFDLIQEMKLDLFWILQKICGSFGLCVEAHTFRGRLTSSQGFTFEKNKLGRNSGIFDFLELLLHLFRDPLTSSNLSFF